MITPLDEFKHMDMLREVERQAADARLIKEAEGYRPGIFLRLLSALTAGLSRRLSNRSERPLPLNHAHIR